jgi:hypothetical protein
MTRGTRGLGLALAVTALLATRAEAQERDFRWNGAMRPGQTLVVRGISGDVEAELASGSEARVEARKTGRSSDFDRVDVVVFEERDEVVFCVVYDGRRTDSDCDTEDDHRDRDRDGVRAGVDFTVYVPEGVDFSGHTVSGNVRAIGLRSDVDAGTVSGDVDVSTTGVATGRTVSGDVDVEMGSLDWRSLDFATVSGDITVTVPDGVDAEIEFESLSGDFDSDFDLRVTRQRNRIASHRVQATIGDGSRSMSFKTVSGDARLRRGRSVIR